MKLKMNKKLRQELKRFLKYGSGTFLTGFRLGVLTFPTIHNKKYLKELKKNCFNEENK